VLPLLRLLQLDVQNSVLMQRHILKILYHLMKLNVNAPQLMYQFYQKQNVLLVLVFLRHILVNKPILVKVLVAAVIAVGVANDKAHGQVTTNTESVMANHCSDCHQYIATDNANISTANTNHEAI
jgi:hypothetical protein